jgi:hypothetical protein
VNRLVPNHGPTLNNLAVIAARQSQVGAALGFYDQAMSASPRNRVLLDNVAEALYGLPDGARGSTIAQKVRRRFDEQDAELARELEKQDLERWGATWVTTEQANRLSIAEREAKDKLDTLAADFDNLQVRLNNIDRDIQENVRAVNNLGLGVGMRTGRDVYGNLYVNNDAQMRAELEQDNQRLTAEREDVFARMSRLREQAKSVNQQLPVPKYTGVQRLMDESQAPVIPPEPADAAEPTTQPATTTISPAIAPADATK